ncbi:MAG: D-aminoacyl-tRNA deacylase [Anaerolineae bacterium]|nr:D-aminoacyl-tRNA deacylase [Anaerolineae bacterium]MDW8070116.1 D-aminoacyl-tRNA deacylase [Anaerolineae bacterium]
MRAVIQRVCYGSVSVSDQPPQTIGAGLVVLVGATHSDTPTEAALLARKTAHLRIFEDDAGKMNRSVLEVGGAILVVPQFTLYADCRHGRRPSFTEAAAPEQARMLIEAFITALRAEGVAHVANGFFGAHMLVQIHNDGPVTIVLDTASL